MNESLPSSATRPTLKTLYRAWGFLHPDFIQPDPDNGASLGEAGLQLVDRKLQMVSGAESIRQSILLLLSTRPGERVMRPEYGCDLYRLVFAPNDDMTAGLAIHYVRQAVERWEPRAEITRLDAGRDPGEPDRLNIVLEYRLRVTQQTEQLFFSLDLTGGNS